MLLTMVISFSTKKGNDKLKVNNDFFYFIRFIQFWFCSNLLDKSNEVQLYSSQLQLRAMTGTSFVQI